MTLQLPLPKLEPLTAEWFILQFLKPWRVEDIDLAINNDVDLEKLILDNPTQTKLFKGNVSLFQDNWTLGDILTWFHIRRPDLFTRLSQPDGTKWVEKHWVKRTKIKKVLKNV